eukprot:scaffold362440_cov32-Prasinocladus_malaysianus.AAC.3
MLALLARTASRCGGRARHALGAMRAEVSTSLPQTSYAYHGDLVERGMVPICRRYAAVSDSALEKMS